MKNLLLLILLIQSIVFSAAYQAKHIKWANLDTLVSRIDTNELGVGIMDQASRAYMPLYMSKLYFDSTDASSWKYGQMSIDSDHRTVKVGMGYEGVQLQLGQEQYYYTFNNSGGTLGDGLVVYAAGIAGDHISIDLADNSSVASSQVLGVLTHDCDDQKYCLVTQFGEVNDVNTFGVAANERIYLGSNGQYTSDPPAWPNARVVLGKVIKSGTTDGVIQVCVKDQTRTAINRTYGFTSNGIGAGTYYSAGFYGFNSTDANLTQGSATVTYGSSGSAYAAHAAIVPSGAGSVTGGGQVGLRVTGVGDPSTGIQLASFTDTVTTDITSLAGNNYYETPGKFSGNITFELYVVSGTPTAYSLDFNYGFAKYEDFSNRKFTVSSFEYVWLAAANDGDFNIELLHHKQTGWTYAATGFVPGNGSVVEFQTDRPFAHDLEIGQPGAYKRTNLNTVVDGAGSEGVLVRITTGANNSIQKSDIQLIIIDETEH